MWLHLQILVPDTSELDSDSPTVLAADRLVTGRRLSHRTDGSIIICYQRDEQGNAKTEISVTHTPEKFLAHGAVTYRPLVIQSTVTACLGVRSQCKG